jgi:hypothetical protein
MTNNKQTPHYDGCESSPDVGIETEQKLPNMKQGRDSKIGLPEQTLKLKESDRDREISLLAIASLQRALMVHRGAESVSTLKFLVTRARTSFKTVDESARCNLAHPPSSKGSSWAQTQSSHVKAPSNALSMWASQEHLRMLDEQQRFLDQRARLYHHRYRMSSQCQAPRNLT